MTAVRSRPTVGALLREAARRLRAAGVSTPDLDARVLYAHVTGLSGAQLIAQARTEAGPETAALFESLVRRRGEGQPVARLTGHREFWGLDFALNADTLVPRPDSETVVQAALDCIDHDDARRAPLKVCDLGTGSGCLLVALLSELPAAFGVGIDISLNAVAAARENARRNGVGARAAFVAGCWADALAGPMDVIVANPPYIARDAIAGLDREVALHDPRRALDGGGDGLMAYRALAPGLARALGPRGVFVAEFGFGQRQAVAGLLSAAGLTVSGVWRDLSGVERVIAARVDENSGPAKTAWNMAANRIGSPRGSG